MVKSLVVGGVVCLIAGLSGCAVQESRPSVASFGTSPEYKLKSAQHWQIVAADVADQIAKTVGGQARVFVPASSASVFGKVFGSQLRSSLISKGVTVSDTEQAALTVFVNVDEVRHSTPRRYAPGTLTALAAGVMVLRDGALGKNDPIGSVVAVALAADVALSAREMNKIPPNEIVLTTSMKRNGNYVMHKSDTYYVDDVDSGLFSSSSRTFVLVGGDGK